MESEGLDNRVSPPNGHIWNHTSWISSSATYLLCWQANAERILYFPSQCRGEGKGPKIGKGEEDSCLAWQFPYRHPLGVTVLKIPFLAASSQFPGFPHHDFSISEGRTVTPPVVGVVHLVSDGTGVKSVLTSSRGWGWHSRPLILLAHP